MESPFFSYLYPLESKHNNNNMKHSLHFQKRILALLIVLFMGTGTVFAYDFSAVCPTGQTLYYNIIDETNHYVEITHPGTYTWNGYPEPTGNITLPSTVTYNGVTYTVKAIGDWAFIMCSNLTGSLTIPNSVTTIGTAAFRECSGFTGSLAIPNSVITIGDDAFNECSGFTGSLTIGSSVTSIGGAAFQSCTGFTGSLTIPNSVTSIGGFAFNVCRGFTGSLTIGNSVTTIEERAFYGCNGFTGSLNIPNSVTSIGDNAFDHCSGFSGSLTIGDSVTSIGSAAFQMCSGFTGSLTIPNSVTSIGDYAFNLCSGFTGSLTISNSVTSIGDWVFDACSGFTGSLIIPNSVTSIGENAFNCCSGLTGVLFIPNTVTTIGDRAFSFCSGLTSMIVLPTTPPILGTNAFYDVSTAILVHVPCESLSAYQSASGWSAFTNMQCYEPLTYSINADGVSVTVTGHVDGTAATGPIIIPTTKTINGVTYTVTAIGNNAFNGCSGLAGPLTIPNTVTTIGDYAFYDCHGFTGSLSIPNSVTSIGGQAFRYCTGFTGSLTIGNSVTTIGLSAFYGCSGFTGSLTIPNSVTTVNSYAFYGCSGFTGSLTIGRSVTTIGNYAFRSCNGFTGSLTIGRSVTSIGNSAFRDCSGFTSMTVCPDAPPSLGSNAFQGVTKTIPVYVPCESLETYQGASGWNAFTNLQCFDPLTYSINADGVSVTVTGHIDGTAATGSIVIPETKTIDGVTYTVTAIGNSAFDGCSGLTGSLTIPNTVTTIGNQAFRSCTGFTGSLTIGSSVTSIGSWAFQDCSGLTTMTVFPATPPSTGTNTFYNVPTDIPVEVPCASLEDYQAASSWNAFTNMQCLDMLTYSINADGVSVTVTGHIDGTAATGPIVIPETKTIDGVTYTVTAIGNNAFKNCSGLTGSLTIPNSVTSIGEGAFWGCSGFTGSLVIPNSVTLIGPSAFNTCIHLTALTIGYAVTTIANYAFLGCSGFTGSLTIPNSVTSIGENAFWDCSGFTGSLVIPSSVTVIASYAFFGCSGLSSLTLPASVTTICKGAFGLCGFSSMTVLPETPPTLGSYVFYDVPTDIPVYVPCGSLEDYQTASGWSDFINIYGSCLTYSINADGVSVTVTGHVDGTAATGELFIPETTTIDGVTYTVTLIGTGAFRDCSGLTGDLIIPNSVTTINAQAFKGCIGLTSLTLPASVTSIKLAAFSGCTGLTTMTVLPATPPSLGSSVFLNVPTDIPVYVPCNAFEGYQNALGWNAFTNMQCLPELTVFDGTVTNSSIPANIIYFDEFTRSQFVIPANVMAGMTGATLYSMTFYTPHTNVPYTTVSDADVYLKEVDYTSISAYESKASATTVYSGRFSIVSAGSGGEMTINFSTPYTYLGGNLLIGVENTETNGWKEIGYYGQIVGGASISGSSGSTETIPATQQDFIPKTTFSYIPGPSTAVTQTIALASGANWFSTNLDIALDDLKAALVAAVPGTNITVKAQNSNTRYLPAQNKWVGNLNTLDLTKMYIITVNADAEITLEGTPVNPAEMPVTIKNGTNWIAFPLSLSMTLTDAFTGFAINGDVVKGQNSSARRVGSRWVGGLTTLEPGEGYLYNSAASADRTFTFPTGK